VVTLLAELKAPKMVSPTRVAVGGSHNRIVVTDPAAKRVHVFSRTGLYRFSFHVDFPLGVAVDGNSRIYVGDKTTGAVRLHEAGGHLLRMLGSGLGEFKNPVDIAWDPSTGEVHVVDSLRHQVRVYNQAGALARTYGSRGSQNGQLEYPKAVALAKGYAWVTDFNNSRVQRFSSAGVWDATLGSFGATLQNFVRPEGIAVDGLDRVYVTDLHLNVLQVIDGKGLHVSYVGRAGLAPGELLLPLDAVFDPYGRLLVTSSKTRKVVIYGIDRYRKPPPEVVLRAVVTVEPATLHPQSRGKWVTAYIELPGHNAGNLVVRSIRLANVPVDLNVPTAVGDIDRDGTPDLMVKLLRLGLTTELGAGTHTARLSALTTNAAIVEGSAQLKVVVQP
jgi:DNA-binding beta-propeller fold protein YncE